MNLFQQLKENFFLLAGPCVIEDEKMLFEIAENLKKITDKLNIPFVFKASYDKANRTSINSFRGPGLEEGLRMLKFVKDKLGIRILTDIHSVEEAEKAAEVADIIQIPAFLSRQTDLLVSAGKTKRIINVKKAQFLSPESVKFIVEKLESVKCKEIIITERGTSFGYGRLIVDFTGIPVMKKLGYPVVFDATHSVQKPSTGDLITGGNRDVIPDLLYASVASGVNGIFMEVHSHPEKAKSDQESQFPLDQLEPVLIKANEIYKVIHNRK